MNFEIQIVTSRHWTGNNSIYPQAGQFSLTKRCVRWLQLLFNPSVSGMILLHFRHFHHKSWSCKNPSFTCYCFLYPPSSRQAYQSCYHNQVHTKHLLFFCVFYHLYVTLPLQLWFPDILPSTLWITEAILTFLQLYPKHKFNISKSLYTRLHTVRGPSSIVGTATCCGLDGPRFDPRWGPGIFSSTKASLPALWSTHPPTIGIGLFLRVNLTGGDVDHPPPPHLAPGLEKSRFIILLPVCASAACQWKNLPLLAQS